MREFGHSELGHAARTKRLVRLASEMILSPAASIPKSIVDPAQAKATYRFLSNPHVSSEGILSGHVRATADRCVLAGAVLALQDTTTLTFHSRALADLGPVNDGEHTKGFLAHTTLAVSQESHEVLGVLHQHVWVRSREKKPKNETSAERKKRSRESEHWGDNQRHAAREIAEARERGSAAHPRVIAVFDREGDIFEAMGVLDELGHSFVIRAGRNRLLEDDGSGAPRYALDEVRLAPVVARKTVSVRARAGATGRNAEIELRAIAARLLPPRSSDRRGDALEVNIVLAEEIGAPPDAQPLCWYLVTREPIETQEQALAIVRAYEARWIIEEFHMGLKTGCSCEDRQMESAHALQNFLAVATPMACELLRLRDAARKVTPLSQCTMLTPTEMKVVKELRPRAMAKATTARHLMRIVANFGGFLNRNTDPDPGWRTLWRGFEAIKLTAIGYELRDRARD